MESATSAEHPSAERDEYKEGRRCRALHGDASEVAKAKRKWLRTRCRSVVEVVAMLREMV